MRISLVKFDFVIADDEERLWQMDVKWTFICDGRHERRGDIDTN